MGWLALAGGVTVLVLIGGFGLFSRNLSKSLGEAKSEIKQLKEQLVIASAQIERATKARPAWDELRGMAKWMSDGKSDDS